MLKTLQLHSFLGKIWQWQSWLVNYYTAWRKALAKPCVCVSARKLVQYNDHTDYSKIWPHDTENNLSLMQDFICGTMRVQHWSCLKKWEISHSFKLQCIYYLCFTKLDDRQILTLWPWILTLDFRVLITYDDPNAHITSSCTSDSGYRTFSNSVKTVQQRHLGHRLLDLNIRTESTQDMGNLCVNTGISQAFHFLC